MPWFVVPLTYADDDDDGDGDGPCDPLPGSVHGKQRDEQPARERRHILCTSHIIIYVVIFILYVRYRACVYARPAESTLSCFVYVMYTKTKERAAAVPP